MTIKLIDDEYLYLYKHLDATDGSLCVLSQSTLKFNKPDNFNDPFDCYFSLDPSFYPKASELAKINVPHAQLSPAKRLTHVNKVRNKLKFNKNITPIIQDIQNKAYICCLNQNPLGQLMWSHYADFHKGFMIELKIPYKKMELLKNFNFIPLKIEYTDCFPVLGREDMRNDQTMIKVFLKKSKEWEYEKEYRVVRYGTFDNVIQSFPLDIFLSSVICGMKTDSTFKQKLRNTLKNTSKEISQKIELYQCEKIVGKYNLTVPNHPRLDMLNR